MLTMHKNHICAHGLAVYERSALLLRKIMQKSEFKNLRGGVRQHSAQKSCAEFQEEHLLQREVIPNLVSHGYLLFVEHFPSVQCYGKLYFASPLVSGIALF